MENLCCLLLVSAFAFFHRPAEAVPSELDRVLAAFNHDFDVCREIDQWSGPESRAAANQECERAFRALDRLELNSCPNWQQAACRVVPGDLYQNYQCTCIISYCNDTSIKTVKGGVVTPFRSCAQAIRQKEVNTRQVQAPTLRFQQARSRFYDSLHEAQLRAANNEGSGESGEPGASSDDSTGSNGVSTTGGAGTSRARRSEDGEGSSTRGTHTSVYRYPRAQFERGESSRAWPNPVRGGPNPVLGDTNPVRKESNPVRGEPIPVSARPAVLRCDECGGHFHSTETLSLHKRIYHKSPRIKRARTTPFVCGICHAQRLTANILRRHEEAHRAPERSCLLCDMIYVSRINYIRHLQKRHPEVPIPELVEAAGNEGRREGDFRRCEDCGEIYKNARCLRDHRKFHEGKTKCDECNKDFKSGSALSSHKRKEHPQ